MDYFLYIALRKGENHEAERLKRPKLIRSKIWQKSKCFLASTGKKQLFFF